jgi:hypothetical protein
MNSSNALILRVKALDGLPPDFLLDSVALIHFMRLFWDLSLPADLYRLFCCYRWLPLR